MLKMPVPEPLQIGNTHLKNLEHSRRQQDGLCFYCGSADHVILQYSVKRTITSGSRSTLQTHVVSLSTFISIPFFMLQAELSNLDKPSVH